MFAIVSLLTGFILLLGLSLLSIAAVNPKFGVSYSGGVGLIPSPSLGDSEISESLCDIGL